MDEALAELHRLYRVVTGRPLDDLDLDVFDLGLASMALLELIARLRDQGYFVTMDDFLEAPDMHGVVRAMAGTRT